MIIDTPDSKQNIVLTLGKWQVRGQEHGEWNNHKYSKGWHRRHGGVWEVSDRTVTFTRDWGNGKRRIVVNLDSWRGAWLAKAVELAGLAPKASKGRKLAPMNIRMHKAYDAHIVRRMGPVVIWQRTLLGEFVDFCAVAKCGKSAVTYHSETMRCAVAGLGKKIRNATLHAQGRLINRDLINSLNFCKRGVQEFCDIVGIENRGAYTPEEIHAAIKLVGYGQVAHFEQELKTLARAVQYEWTH